MSNELWGPPWMLNVCKMNVKWPRANVKWSLGTSSNIKRISNECHTNIKRMSNECKITLSECQMNFGDLLECHMNVKWPRANVKWSLGTSLNIKRISNECQTNIKWMSNECKITQSECQMNFGLLPECEMNEKSLKTYLKSYLFM